MTYSTQHREQTSRRASACAKPIQWVSIKPSQLWVFQLPSPCSASSFPPCTAGLVPHVTLNAVKLKVCSCRSPGSLWRCCFPQGRIHPSFPGRQADDATACFQHDPPVLCVTLPSAGVGTSSLLPDLLRRSKCVHTRFVSGTKC